MILNLIVIAIVLGVGATWGLRGKGRGMFSAMIACICVIVSGAIAFAVWEPLVYGVLLAKMPDLAWGLGLLLPFCIALGITRAIAEASVPKNLDLNDATNFIGGTVFGLIMGVIVAGIVVTSLSFMRFPPSLLGYRSIKDDRGNLTYATALWIPADKITIGVYEYLSSGALSSATPLRTRSPKLYEQAAMSRMVYTAKGDGGKASLAKTTIRGEDFTLKGRFRVTGSVNDLVGFVDDLGNPGEQTVKYPDGSGPKGESRVEGFFIEFKASGAEKTGQIVVSPGQLRLIAERKDGSVIAVHPFSVYAQPAAGGSLTRFRVASDDLHFPSVGGGSSAVFGFEFLVPADATPTDLFIKNYRVELNPKEDVKTSYAGFKARDQALRDGKLVAAMGVSPGGARLDTKTVDTSGSQTVSSDDVSELIRVDETLPNRWIINKGSGVGGLVIRDSDNKIIDGQFQFTIEQLSNLAIDRKLKVDGFAATDDTGIVRVELARGQKQSLLGRSVETAESILQPLLADANGNLYEPIGYVYSDGRTVDIRFKPGEPLRALSQIPALSTAKQNQTLYLIFRPTKGARITRFLLGSKEIAQFPGGVLVN